MNPRVNHLDVVRHFFRESLEERYDPETLARLPGFRDLDPATLSALRRFVLDRLYPPPAEREALDQAFQTVRGMLAHPVKTGRAAMVLSRVLLFRGKHVPFLIHTAGLLIDAYEAIRTIEMETARELEQTGKTGCSKRSPDRAALVKAASRVQRTRYERFVEGVYAILTSFTNVQGWEVALQVAATLDEAFGRDSFTWTREEQAAVALARELLEECVNLARHLSPAQIHAVAEGIRAIETKWVNGLYTILTPPDACL